jgi:AraC family transcriptional regulator
MILTAMPDLPPRPLNAANAAFREAFYRRWGRENALVCGRSREASYETHPQTLSVKAAWGGRERYFLREREVAVDDDHWLVLNQGRAYGSQLRGPRPVTSLALFVRPELPGQVAAQRRRSLAAALDGPEATAALPEFAEHLRAHGGAVSRRLALLYREAVAGERSEDWLETQALLLMDELLGEAPALPRDAARSARAELERRLRLAADFIDSCHAQPLTLDDMARVACLSRYHFVRHFRALHGITPYAWLLRKRARVARRLLAAGPVDREAVALAAGFGSRFALARALARYPG